MYLFVYLLDSLRFSRDLIQCLYGLGQIRFRWGLLAPRTRDLIALAIYKQGEELILILTLTLTLKLERKLDHELGPLDLITNKEKLITKNSYFFGVSSVL